MVDVMRLVFSTDLSVFCDRISQILKTTYPFLWVLQTMFVNFCVIVRNSCIPFFAVEVVALVFNAFVVEDYGTFMEVFCFFCSLVGLCAEANSGYAVSTYFAFNHHKRLTKLHTFVHLLCQFVCIPV